MASMLRKLFGRQETDITPVIQQPDPEPPRLLESSAGLRACLDCLRANVFVADLDFNLVYMNAQAEETIRPIEDEVIKVFGVSVDDLLGGSIHRFHRDPERVERILGDYLGSLPRKAVFNFGKITLRTTINAVTTPDGVLLGYIVFWDDITQIMATERQVQEAHQREQDQAEDLRAKVEILLKAVEQAAGGDLGREVPVRGKDAIGRVGNGFAELLTNLRSSLGSIADNTRQVAGEAEALLRVAEQLRGNADNTSQRSERVSDAADQVNQGVETAAAAAEQMSVSVREIAQNAAQASNVATKAVDMAQTAATIMSRLGSSSHQIGDVLKVINSIAEQTNLLALNATIEAARAGEAGKGFAVVANEVKELAKETARATEDIGGKIQDIQSDTGQAVSAIEQIQEIIGQINDIQHSVAAAVEEQTAVTADISRTVSGVARDSGDIAQNMTEVTDIARGTAKDSEQVEQTAATLARMAETLESLIRRFRY